MKPRERIEMALNHQRPDRCPWQVGMTQEFLARLEKDGRNQSLARLKPSYRFLAWIDTIN